MEYLYIFFRIMFDWYDLKHIYHHWIVCFPAVATFQSLTALPVGTFPTSINKCRCIKLTDAWGSLLLSLLLQDKSGIIVPRVSFDVVSWCSVFCPFCSLRSKFVKSTQQLTSHLCFCKSPTMLNTWLTWFFVKYEMSLPEHALFLFL